MTNAYAVKASSHLRKQSITAFLLWTMVHRNCVNYKQLLSITLINSAMFNCPSQIWGKIRLCSFWSWENVTLLRRKPVWKAKLHKTFFTWHISTVGSPVSPHFAYLWTSSVKGSLVKVEWCGIFLRLWSHCPVTFVLKAGEGISDVVRDPREVVSPDKEIVFHRKE